MFYSFMKYYSAIKRRSDALIPDMPGKNTEWLSGLFHVGSAIKSTPWLLFRGPTLSPLYTCGVSQLCITLVPGDPIFSADLCRHRLTWGQNSHTHKRKHDFKDLHVE